MSCKGKRKGSAKFTQKSNEGKNDLHFGKPSIPIQRRNVGEMNKLIPSFWSLKWGIVKGCRRKYNFEGD